MKPDRQPPLRSRRKQGVKQLDFLANAGAMYGLTAAAWEKVLRARCIEKNPLQLRLPYLQERNALYNI